MDDRSRKTVLVAVIALVALTSGQGCYHHAARGLTHSRIVRPAGGADGVAVALRCGGVEICGRLAPMAARAIRVASRWGKIKGRVTIWVHPNGKTMGRVLRGRYQKWIRAWATWHGVHLQSPDSWRGRVRPEIVQELLTHELTHVIMYRLIGTPGNWTRKKTPVWFREGMSSVTADQGYRRAGMRSVARFLGTSSAGKALTSPARLLHSEQRLIYSASHWMFVYFLDKHGPAAAGKLMAAMARGKSFEQAFKVSTGEGAEAFETEFRAIMAGAIGSAGPASRPGR